MEKLKIGIVGNGGISQCHAESYKAAADRAEIYALCDINYDRALAMAGRLGIPKERVFNDVHDMVKLPELDAVDDESLADGNSTVITNAEGEQLARSTGKLV
ncbi:MAG: Gfo/Idh/MocA family oxidoreductase, partial [Clostridia bacterium]|nr:Gfo/Idh/MocA family oxidoreductase [Clostridia bacterium]